MSDSEESPTGDEPTGSSASEVASVVAAEKFIDDSVPSDFDAAVWRFEEWKRQLAEASRRDDGNDGTSTLACLDHDGLDAGVQVSPSISVLVQRFEPGEGTEKHRHNTSAVNFVVRGSGYSHVGDERIEWNQYDTFVVPAWDYHRHVNDGNEEVLLYTVQSLPLQRQLRAQVWQEGEDGPVHRPCPESGASDVVEESDEPGASGR